MKRCDKRWCDEIRGGVIRCETIHIILLRLEMRYWGILILIAIREVIRLAQPSSCRHPRDDASVDDFFCLVCLIRRHIFRIIWLKVRLILFYIVPFYRPPRGCNRWIGFDFRRSFIPIVVGVILAPFWRCECRCTIIVAVTKPTLPFTMWLVVVFVRIWITFLENTDLMWCPSNLNLAIQCVYITLLIMSRRWQLVIFWWIW